ncbi:MAG: molybdopterin-dependent oxidoreductase, partial [Geminicoccales bacterium]
EISWDQALSEIAQRLGAIRAAHGAEAVAFAVTTPSGTPMVDSIEWVERFVRCFGSPNLVYAVEVCGWHKDYAHALTFGRGIGFPDHDHAEAIVLWGHNPARTWLAQAARVAAARRRGARVAVVDPKPNGSGQQADLWLRVRPGADGALAMGGVRHLIAESAYDAEFVRNWTNAPMLVDPETGRLLRARDLWPDASEQAFVVADETGKPQPYDTRFALARPGTIRLNGPAMVRAADGRALTCRTVFDLLAAEADAYTLDHVAALTWLAPADISAFYGLFCDRPRLAYHSWTGVGQHTNATLTERAIATLYALTGACDRRGGNVWPVPPPTRTLNDYALLAPEQRAKALGLHQLPLGPPSHGWITARDFGRAVLEGVPYRVRALVSFGTNFMVSQGASSRNREILEALEFQVHVDMFMNPTAESADIVLPASMPWEREALRIGFEITQEAAETIQLRPQALRPPGECKADYEIAAALAIRLGMGDRFFDGDIEAGWNYQLAPLGITAADLRARPEGVRFRQPFRHEKHAVTGEDGSVAGFGTPCRRVELYSERMLEHDYPPLPCHVEPAESPLRAGADRRWPFVLTTAKSGWYVHSSHRHVASLRRKSPDPAVEINRALADSRGLAAGDWAIVETPRGRARLRVRLNDDLDERVAIAEFGWWEDCPALGRARTGAAGVATSNINDALGDAARDPVSGSVPLRAVACDIRRDEAASRGLWTGRRAFSIVGRRAAASDVVALELAPRDDGPLPDFLPGQHVIVTLPASGLSRAYSLTGPQVAPRSLSIAIKRIVEQDDAGGESTGRMSGQIHGLRVGDELLLETPRGVFIPPLRGERPVLLVADGIGITPFIGYLESLVLVEPAERVPAVMLLHGCRNRREHPFASRLAELNRRLPELRLVTAYSSPGPDDRCPEDYDQRGRLDLGCVDHSFIARRPLAYLCGSRAFIDAMTGGLVERGMPRFDIFTEAFASPPEVPPTLAPQTIHIAGSDASFVWSPGLGTLLDAADAAGLALP